MDIIEKIFNVRKEPATLQKKFCIVPKKRRMLQELVQGMELAEEEAQLLDACTILHVEIDPAANGWEIVLQTPELLSDALLSRVSAQIQQKCNLFSVEFYQQVIDMMRGISKAWDELAYRTADGDPSVQAVFERMKYRAVGDKLVLEVAGICSGAIMRNHKVASKLAKNIKGLLGFYCDVDWESVDAEDDEDAEGSSSADALNTPE